LLPSHTAEVVVKTGAVVLGDGAVNTCVFGQPLILADTVTVVPNGILVMLVAFTVPAVADTTALGKATKLTE
jgi:hypothetical protein